MCGCGIIKLTTQFYHKRQAKTAICGENTDICGERNVTRKEGKAAMGVVIYLLMILLAAYYLFCTYQSVRAVLNRRLKKCLRTAAGLRCVSAGVVLLAAFGDDQIPVDTHVFRVSNRIGLARATTANGVEKQLREVLPQEIWSHAHHLLIWHGRRCCSARTPTCDRCPLNNGLCEKNTLED